MFQSTPCSEAFRVFGLKERCIDHKVRHVEAARHHLLLIVPLTPQTVQRLALKLCNNTAAVLSAAQLVWYDWVWYEWMWYDWVW
jgi:phosphopantothenoylcysteine synthetase/decarboxylase